MQPKRPLLSLRTPVGTEPTAQNAVVGWIEVAIHHVAHGVAHQLLPPLVGGLADRLPLLSRPPPIHQGESKLEQSGQREGIGGMVFRLPVETEELLQVMA
jgi:hypothetical protein